MTISPQQHDSNKFFIADIPVSIDIPIFDHLLDLLLASVFPDALNELSQILVTNITISIDIHHPKGVVQFLLGLLLIHNPTSLKNYDVTKLANC